MKENNMIDDLLKNHKWPGINSVIFPDGKLTLLEVNFFGVEQYFICPVLDSSLESYVRYNEDELTEFDVFANISNDHIEASVGDGSAEGNGVIYLQNKVDRRLIWFLFVENGGPFENVALENGYIRASSSENVLWNIAINNPLDIKLIYP